MAQLQRRSTTTTCKTPWKNEDTANNGRREAEGTNTPRIQPRRDQPSHSRSIVCIWQRPSPQTWIHTWPRTRRSMQHTWPLRSHEQEVFQQTHRTSAETPAAKTRQVPSIRCERQMQLRRQVHLRAQTKNGHRPLLRGLQRRQYRLRQQQRLARNQASAQQEAKETSQE